MNATAATPDPITDIPKPDAVRAMIADGVERTQFLRQLLRLSLRVHSGRDGRRGGRTANAAGGEEVGRVAG